MTPFRHFRIWYKKLGGHYHCRVFSGGNYSGNFAKLGDLTLDEGDWVEKEKLFSAYAEFIEEYKP